MTAERLLKLFDRVAEAPNAVPRLRRLVLDLAVRGRLTNQVPGEHVSAVSPVDRKANRVTSRATVALSVPQTWSSVALAQVCQSITDGDHLPPPRAESGVPLLVIGNIRTGHLRYDGERFVPTDYYQGLDDTRRPRQGDLLYTLVGSFGIPAVVRDERAFCVQRHIGILRPSKAVEVEYLTIALGSSVSYAQAASTATGIAQKTVSLTGLRRMLVPLPPLPEQRRIVAKVDELMALCDRLEAAQKEREAARHRFGSATVASIASADTSAVRLSRFDEIAHSAAGVTGLRSAVMELAVTGRLVPQSPDDAPLAIPSTMPNRQSSRGNPGPSLPPAGVRTRLPEAWTSGCVADWFEVSGGIQKTPARTPNSNPHPYVGVSNVHRGRLDLHTVKQFELVPGELDRFALKPGDLLVVEGNGSRSEVGRCALWSGEIENCVHQNHIIRCRPRADGLSPFTLTYLNSPLGIELLTSLAITSSGLYSLSVGKIRAVPIVMPPLAEQHRIVAKVNELMALCDQLEAHLKAGDIARSRLLDALIAETLAEAHAESP